MAILHYGGSGKLMMTTAFSRIGRVKGDGNAQHAPLHIGLLENTDMRNHRSRTPASTQTTFPFPQTISEGILGETPQLGEVRRAKQLGYKGWAQYIWTPCADCRKGRWVQFNHAKYKNFRCKSCAQKLKRITTSGPLGPSWKGGRHVHRGYVCVWIDKKDPLSCMARSNGYVSEHRLVMAKSIGRPLRRDEAVHHKNGNKLDNRLENLELMSTKDHARLHSGELAAEVQVLRARIAELEGKEQQ